MKRLANRFGMPLMTYWILAIISSGALLSWTITEASDSVAHTINALVIGASGAMLTSVLILYALAKLQQSAAKRGK